MATPTRHLTTSSQKARLCLALRDRNSSSQPPSHRLLNYRCGACIFHHRLRPGAGGAGTPCPPSPRGSPPSSEGSYLRGGRSSTKQHWYPSRNPVLHAGIDPIPGLRKSTRLNSSHLGIS